MAGEDFSHDAVHLYLYILALHNVFIEQVLWFCIRPVWILHFSKFSSQIFEQKCALLSGM